MLSLLKNARLYAPEPAGVAHVLIAGGSIAAIESEPPDTGSMPVAVVDLEGRAVIPGLIDAHAHVTGGGGESGYASAVPAPLLRAYTGAGVTTVVGLLGTDDTVRTTGSLVARTRALRELGLSAFCYTGGYHVPPTTLTGSVRSDIVYIDCVIGAGEIAISDHRSSQPTLDELLRLAADCHVAGLMTGKAGVLHLHLGDGERALTLVRDAIGSSELPARVFHPTHVNRNKPLFDEALDLARSGCTVDITAFPVGEDEPGWSAADAVTRFFESGVDPGRVTVSSDGGGCLPKFDADGRVAQMAVGDPATLLETLAVLTGRGVDLGEAIRPFTSNVARQLRFERKGRLARGCDADLVVLDDRLSPWGVMAGGVWHVFDHLPRILDPFDNG